MVAYSRAIVCISGHALNAYRGEVGPQPAAALLVEILGHQKPAYEGRAIGRRDHRREPGITNTRVIRDLGVLSPGIRDTPDRITPAKLSQDRLRARLISLNLRAQIFRKI
jgi:hypothetical protein